MSAVIIFFACTKENNEAAIQNSPAQTNLTQNDLKINNLIKTFKDKIAYYKANPDLKDGETVPADSALWYLEATINYSHAFPNEYYDGFEIDTSYITVPVNSDGTVDMSVLTQKYEEMKSNVAADYHNSQFTEKGLSFVDLSEVSGSDNTLTLEVKTATGEKNNEPPPPTPVDGPFSLGDNWWYGEDAGKCDEAAGEGKDAAKRLWEEAQATIPDPNGNYTFIGPFIYKEIEGGNDEFLYPNDPQPNDNHLDYYLFYASTEYGPCGDDTLCLEYPEMNTYWNRLKYLMYHFYLDQAGWENYDIMCIFSFDDDSYPYESNNITYTKYFHYGTLKFGIKIYYSSGDGPEEL